MRATKKATLFLVSVLTLVCMAVAAVVGLVPAQSPLASEADGVLTQATPLTALSYTVSDASGNDKGSVNVNAKNGGILSLGPAAARTQYKVGLSLLTFSASKPATVTVGLSDNDTFDVFATDFGVDGVSSGSATFRFLVDGAVRLTKTVTATDFHGHFETELDGMQSLVIEVTGAQNTCVTLGNASFYDASTNAVSHLVENATLGGWPVPLQRNQNLYGGALRIGTRSYDHGFSINSTGSFELKLLDSYGFFTAELGIDESVAGGSNAGSVTVEVQALDASNTVLRKVTTPVLYGYMQAYPVLINVLGASRLRFVIGDGGNGISNDMLSIGAPTFSMTLGGSTAYLSDFVLTDGSVGSGTVGLDRTAAGEELAYAKGADRFAFDKGIGLSLKQKAYTDYVASPLDTTTYAHASFDVTGAGATYFEAVAIAPTGAGAFVEVWCDGVRIADGVSVGALTDGGAPVRVGAVLPDGAQTLELRAIAKEAGDGGALDLVNAQLFGADVTFGAVRAESLSATHPYPFGRNVTPFGGALTVKKSDGTGLMSHGIALMSGASVTLAVRESTADMLRTTLALAADSTGELTFTLTATGDEGQKVYTSPVITATNSYYDVSTFLGAGVKEITLSVHGTQGAVGVWGECSLVTSGYKSKERIAELDWTASATGWGTINIDKDVMGYPINVGGVTYDKGISMHAFYDQKDYSYVQVNLPVGLGYTLFASRIGVSKDTANNGTAGSVKFFVEGDGELLYESNLMRVSDEARYILVDITGVSNLRLMVNNGEGSYDCDFAAWIDPVIARSSTDLDDYLELSGPIANQSVSASASNVFTVSGRVLGSSTSVDVYLNDAFVATAQAGDFGQFRQPITVRDSGKNTIRVEAGGLCEEIDIYVSGAAIGRDSVTLSTATTRVTVEPAVGGMLVKDVSRVGGYDWLDGDSFVAFPSEIRLGGENGTPYTLDWQYQGYKHGQERVTAQKVDVFGNDYVGDKYYEIYTYTDDNGFTLESVWSAHQNYVGPVYHEIYLYNHSGEPIYVTQADTLTLTLDAPDGETLTNSYSYKGAVYQTSYGYRLDTVTDGYDMEVFCSTDYNNGMQIDAGYIPWASLHAGNEGVNLGVVWSDCRVRVYGTGDDVYVEAGLRPRFETVIPDGQVYEVPASFIDAYGGSIDDGSNQLKKHLFAFSMPECNRLDDMLPAYGYNLWELLDLERRSWRMSDEKFYEGVYQLGQAGVDEITIDTYWWKDIGDWRGVHQNWQSSMTYSSNFVHANGMDFSIYMQAGNGLSTHTDAMTANGIAANSDWFARLDNGTWDELCLADPDAYAFITDYLTEYHMELGLDGIRTDFGYIIGYCNKPDHQHIDTRNDVGYWTSKNCYELFDTLYELFPVPTDVNDGSEVRYFKWEDCNCGGTLKDFASMKRATRIQTTDAYDPINVRRSFYDASFVFPSMQLMLWMNDYMYNPDGPFDNDYRFWSQLMGAPVPMTSMPSDMPPEMYDSFVRSIEIYHDWMQELVKYGDVYHNMPRADGIHWDGVEYFHPDTGKGAVLAFKPDPDGTVEDTYRVRFDGIDPAATYYVWSEAGYIPFTTKKGSELMAGLDLTIEKSYGAEIIYFMDVTAEGAAEVVAKPAAFAVDASVTDSDLAITTELNEGAEYYNFRITEDGNMVYEFAANELTAKNNLVKGLGAGDYVLTVQAINRFGMTETVEQFTVTTGSELADKGYAVQGAADGGVVIDGAHYVNGNTLDLTDLSFGVAASKTVTVTDIGSASTLNVRLALGEGDADEAVKVSVYGVNGTQQTLLREQTVTHGQAYYDVAATVTGYESVVIKGENVTPDVYCQSASGYGRTGLYGGAKATEYAFTADVTVLRNGLNETFPRAGMFAAYVNDNSFAAFYVDAYYSNIVIYERSSGQSTDKTTRIAMPDGFDYYAKHTLSVQRNGSQFVYQVDGEVVATRTLSLGASQVALITEDAEARFAGVSRTVGGTSEALSWSVKDTNVNIKGQTEYGTKITSGIWSRPAPKLLLVLH